MLTNYPCNTTLTSLIKKPIPPIAIVPKKQIFIDSQSSVLPGFLANFSSLDAD